MIQRKQTLYLLAAIIMTVICLCMQIGSFKLGGISVAKVYNLWYTDPIGKHHFDTWPLMAVLLPTAVIATYTIFIYNNRKMQALFCLFNVLFIIGWYVVFFVVGCCFPSLLASCIPSYLADTLLDGSPSYPGRRKVSPLDG